MMSELEDLQARQVVWYRSNGRYPDDRIVHDSGGNEYVIGDWSWSRMRKTCPTCKQTIRTGELIEHRMSAAMVPQELIDE